MGLFKRKRDKGLDNKSRNKKSNSLLTSFDRMIYFVVHDCSHKEMMDICNSILNGRAVLANFDKVDSSIANNMLSFISGVVYAKEGEVIKINTRLFLFARKEEYEDGSLHQYVEDTK